MEQAALDSLHRNVILRVSIRGFVRSLHYRLMNENSFSQALYASVKPCLVFVFILKLTLYIKLTQKHILGMWNYYILYII